MFKNTKKLMPVFAVILAIAVALAGCGKQEGAPKAEGEKKAEGLSGSITIAGSTSVQPVSEELAKAFMAKNPGVTVNVQGGGSSAGVKAANEGAAQIGASSRELKEEEKGLGLTETKIALDGIAVVVNSKNQVSELTMEQVKGIFSGKITNWKEVGGKDAPINVVNREEGSGTRGAFEELVLGKDAKFTEKALTQPSTGAVRTTVAGDENAIGYVSLGSLNQEVKGIKVDGAEPTIDNVKNGSFKISRPFLYLTKGEMNEVTKAYIDFVMSEEGQKIVKEAHFIPVK
ncbi:phosphate ABC transporter substrate-binding protein [Desulforamulus hydrothermalis]|uniref:Phosphate-binding protein n=1 Tax=Desulforamulus hydrothermalis Lam5 = DSM 18033 TaxID=1121428 RepID=K8DX63_9FIRM|nr:phosphate ABC transporter substrate-binding protein [Desulforamulus hydrothermalis]CCO07035.1 Phosphate binding protein [Desulforamulus hydrothermalis Lam5 = DSM 18033]SHG97102.1 phosphate ABC transporter substrate-binding protein, PhoT family (TC 3.A.1.7.1) [Desulforamulus hydrothermalis Lam5 = DSM 18033]